MLADGGVMQEGGTVDPVSGNEVPIGSMKEEVRDDIDAKLSEGEFVFPADVVRYWGLEKLMMMRDKAKKGLQRMNDIGQMGNAEEVPDAEALHSDEDEMDDDTFSSEIDSIIGETDAESMGGKREFAAGGFAQPGTDYLAKYNIPRSSISNPALDVRAYKNAEGRLMYITFFNGKPSTPIPEGFKYVGTGQELLTTKPEEVKKPETATDTTATGTLINDGQAGGDGSSTTGTPSTDADGLATASTVSPTAVAVGLTGLAAAAGFPAVASPSGMVTGFVTDAINSISHSIAAAANVAAVGSPAAVDSHSQASNTAPTATTGSSGTGGAAASAASSAAAAAGANAANAAAADAADAEGGGLGTGATGGVGGIGGTTAADGVGADGMGVGTGVGVGGGGVGAGDGGGGIGAGEGLAKGGLVSKRKNSPKPIKTKGLAGRR